MMLPMTNLNDVITYVHISCCYLDVQTCSQKHQQEVTTPQHCHHGTPTNVSQIHNML